MNDAELELLVRIAEALEDIARHVSKPVTIEQHYVPPEPDLLSVTEAAKILGISRQAVQQQINSGSLKAKRVGKTYALAKIGILKDLA